MSKMTAAQWHRWSEELDERCNDLRMDLQQAKGLSKYWESKYQELKDRRLDEDSEAFHYERERAEQWKFKFKDLKDLYVAKDVETRRRIKWLEDQLSRYSSGWY